MTATLWEPTEKNWGDLAHLEVMETFEGQLKTRAVALCVWYLSVQPDITPYEIETMARRDPEIEIRADGTKINSYALKQAKKLLGETTDGPPESERRKTDRRRGSRRKKRVVSQALARLDETMIERLDAPARIVDDFLQGAIELAQIQASFAKARRELLTISHEDAVELADLHTDAAQALGREGLLTPPEGEPEAIWPD